MSALTLASLLKHGASDTLLPEDRARQARDAALALGIPGGGREDWLYTKMSGLLEESFLLEAPAGILDEAALQPLVPEGVDAYRIVFENGRMRNDLCRLEGLPEQVGIGSLAGMRRVAAEGHAEAAAMLERLDKLAGSGTRALSALNAGLAGDGIGIWLPDEMELDKPLLVVCVVSGAEQALLIQPRLLVVAGRNSSLTLVDSHGGPDAADYFSNAICEFFLDEGARVEHVRVQRDSRQARCVTGLFARVGAGADFRSHGFTFGGSQVRNESRVELVGPGAHGEINGLVLLASGEHVDNHTWFEHAEPDCTSRQLFKSVLDGDSTSIFSGRIHVHRKGQRTDAVQSGDAMLLSDRARSVARPQLEIYADDVKCTHGSTVGNLDETAMFYMRSRGIPADLARRILMHAFAAGLLSRLIDQDLARPLDRLITRTLAEA